MNKVYFFIADADHGGVYIAAKNFKEAKLIAINHELITEYCDDPYIDVRGHICRNRGNNKPVTTDFEGELTMKEIFQLRLAWWECPECGSNDFEVIDKCEECYRCKDCRYEEAIPYVGI